MFEFNYFRITLFQNEPCIIQNMNDYHTRIRCKGFSFVVANTELTPATESYLLITFYKNKEVKVLKEKKFSLIIETDDLELEVSKKQLNFIFCKINKDLIEYYKDKFGICFTKTIS